MFVDKSIPIRIPHSVQFLLLCLQNARYEAYIVGGCVRDSLLGKEPKDWDICTSAKPDETKAVCKRYGIQTIDTGIKHGTITAKLDSGEMYEITTYRIDGEYTDSRHPDSVEFVDSLEADLSRRDFTINAMAYNKDGLIDPFHGREHLKQKLVTCVGNPDNRFSEDALRMLRAMRFAAVYDFKIDSRTAESIHRNKQDLENIAAERIQSELSKMLCGDGALQVLTDFSDVIATVIPELRPCIGFEQNNQWHQYDVYEHIANAVVNYSGEDLIVKYALLFHDIAKPMCYSEDERGGHFYGHPSLSWVIAEEVMDRLRFDNKTKEAVLQLVLYHDASIDPSPTAVKRWLNKLGEEQFYRLLEVKAADNRAQSNGAPIDGPNRCKKLRIIAAEVIANRECFSLKDLAINGDDIIALGVPEGKRVGELLNHALNRVIKGTIENDANVLLGMIKDLIISENPLAVPKDELIYYEVGREEPEILGSGSSYYHVQRTKDLNTALDYLQTCGRNYLLKYMRKNGKAITVYWDFNKEQWSE